MTHIIILVRQTGFPAPNVPPPLAVILAAIEGEGGGEQDLQPVADGAGEELGVDVEGEGGVAVFGVGGEAGDAVVFLGVDGGEGEGVGEEVRVCHCCVRERGREGGRRESLGTILNASFCEVKKSFRSCIENEIPWQNNSRPASDFLLVDPI